MRNQRIIFFFLLLFVFISISSVFSTRNSLSRGSSLTVKDASNTDDFLISPDNTFTCGFYSLGTNAYWFSIWFTNSNERTVIWTANRDHPVNRRGSQLSLRHNGVMVLTDFDGSTTWQTNSTVVDVDRAELLNTGNLVIRDNGGNILWQSFDFPTDTLLPHQLFTKNNRLVSRIGPQTFGSGYYNFFFDSDTLLKLIYDGPEVSSIYWPNLFLNIYENGRTNYNSSRIAVLDDTGTFSSSDRLQFTASDSDVGGDVMIKRRLTLDYDGNMRVYSLSESSGLWDVTWQALSKPCDVHGVCGRNGICVYTPEPKCSCPPSYDRTDLSDWSQGCKPRFQRNCSDSEFVEISHVDYYGFDLANPAAVSYDDCRQLCLEDCQCEGFSYRITGHGTCYTKSPLFNGFRSNDFPGSIYLRVPRSSVHRLNHVIDLNVSRLDCGINRQGRVVVLPNTYDITNQRFNWVYLYSFAIIIGALEVILLVAGWLLLFKKNGLSSSMEDGYRAISNQFRSFSYNELKTATRKFKEVIGQGGFGAVYKGILTDERLVAVKKLGDIVQGEEEFWAEVSTIGKINHMNLARMWGFCSERKHRLLVYEFHPMNNQTALFFLLLFFISTTSSVVLAKNFLSRGSSLTVKDVTNSDNLLISPDKTFSCGFHSFGTNAYWFSIWYTNTKEQTIVWTANPDKPVNRRGSRLSLRRNGAMVLIDYDGTTAWETNTTKSNNKPLVSRIGPQMVGSGYYSLFFDSGNVLKLIYDGPEISSIYWPDITLHAYQNGRTHANNSRIAILDDMGTFSSSDQLEFSASDVGVGIRRRITLDYDGNLRVYSLNESSGFWNITWQAVAMPCDVHGLCGRNGICVYTPEPKCSCPPNYEPTDLSDWNKGCKPKFHRSCSDSEFVELTHVDYYGFDLNRTQSTSYEDCRQSCLTDCRCEAFNYRHTGEALCVTKNSLFNGVRSVNFSGSMYLRVPRSRTQTLNLVMDYNVSHIDCGSRGRGKVLVLPNIYDITNQRFKWIYIYVFAFVIGTLEVVLLAAGWWFLYRKHGLSASMEDGYRAISNQFRSFNYSELRNATKNFKEIIGRGGFGAVYKGILADKRVVAVKKLENVVQGEEEFWAEVSTIGKINHMNLARMWGFCCGKKQRLLVYEHVENGSLDQHLWVVDDHDGFEEVPELLRFMRIAKKKMQNGEDSWVEDLIDPRLEGKFNRNQAATMIEVGLSCVQDDRNKRPTMESVVQVLAECEEEMPVHTPCTI
ncbi:hypothetical protein BVRB_3g058390 [Beta vulgaris subsp. vulgaris]|nr:hypothetical protein BVRB_3g058390 [Beta vulgaris subsp. vulgaris]